MNLDDEAKIAKAIGVRALSNLPEPKLRELVEHFDEIPPELKLHLLKTNPELQQYVLRAVTAVEDDLRATMGSMNENTRQAFDALHEVREIIAGELNKDGLSDERWRYLMDRLTENADKASVVTEEANQLIAQQANASRRTKFAIGALPYIEVVVKVGVQLLITKGRP